jgi:DNA-binding transcriptional ArsR family regulator
MKCNSYEKFFETFGNKTRIKIIGLLKNKESSVNDICLNLNEEQSKISHNLKILARCNIVNVKKEGKKRIYSLNKETILPILNFVDIHVKKNCCKKCIKKK